MARINRTDVIQKAVNDLALNVSVDKIPNESLDKIQFNYSLNRELINYLTSTSSTATGTLSLALPSVSAGSEILLDYITFSFAKDATCDVATGSLPIAITPDSSGVSTACGGAAVLTLTADSQTFTIVFPKPIKLKPGTTITSTGTFTVGAMSRRMSAGMFVRTSN